ncbi:MAG: DUF2325 domain-containing protein [Desulfarculaceae bacterium]|nr:DUF2325 domain-containing protein [Desulfarculaceae bacterium]
MALTQESGGAASLEWHQDCLVVTLLLGAAFDKKALKKHLKRAGLPEEAQQGRGEALLHALHEACHTNPQAQAAVSKELSARFRATLHKTASLSGGEILAQARDTAWPIPLLWACYQGEGRERREAGRRLAHLVAARGMKRLQGESLVEREKGRAETYCAQNRALRQSLEELKAENRDLALRLKTPQVRSEPAVPQAAAPSPHKKRAKELGRELEQARAEIEQLRNDLAVWRALALQAEEEARAAQAGAEACCSAEACPEACPDCGQARAGARPARSRCPLRGRSVAVIGGLDRLEKNYTEIIEQMGGSCLCHTGKVRSGARRLRQIVNKSDLVVFLTPINSHAAMNVVKKQCKLCEKPFCPLNCTSPTALESHLIQLSQDRALSA